MSEKIGIRPTEGSEGVDQPLTFSISDVDMKEFEEKMEQYGFAKKSRAARYFLNIGMKSIAQNDPRNTRSNNEPTKSGDSYRPVTIREFIPEGKENSLDIRDELLSEIEGDLLDICRNDPEITVDNFQVYR